MLAVSLPLSASEGTQNYVRPGFSFQFKKSWLLADKDPDFNADTYMTIESQGNTNIRIEIFTMGPGVDVDDLLFNAMYVLDGTLIQVSGREDISAIGPLKGAGKHMVGKVMHMFPGGSKVFFHQNGDQGLMLTLIYWNEEFADGDSCLELIAKTFQFKKN